MKVCTKCKIEKEFNEYTKQKNGNLGLRSICKKCCAIYFKENYNTEKAAKRHQKDRETKLDKLRESRRKAAKKYYAKNIKIIKVKNKERVDRNRLLKRKKRESGKKYFVDKEKQKQAVVRWQLNNPKKMRCAQKLRLAVKQGKIIKPKYCQICGEIKKLEGHHYDYDKPLEVIFCCRLCHATLDRVRRIQEK